MKMKCLVLMMVLGLSAVSYGAFFDPLLYDEASELVGQGGWVTNYNSNGSAMPSTVQSGPVQYDAAWGDGAYTWSGAARDITADAAGGQIEVISTFHSQYPAPGKGNNFQITIGDSGITENATSNHLTLIHDGRPTVRTMSLYMHIDGVYTYAGMVNIGIDFDPYVQYQLKVAVDLGADSAGVYYRDVDDVTYAPIGDGSWTHLGDWNAPLPMTSITQLGVGTADYAYWHNIEVIPEPMTMTLLGVGGLFLARRRRD